jgi:hypothetical protein
MVIDNMLPAYSCGGNSPSADTVVRKLGVVQGAQRQSQRADPDG